ncbi:hypothetical protein Tco_1034688 [Tanacetum coccineum]
MLGVSSSLAESKPDTTAGVSTIPNVNHVAYNTTVNPLVSPWGFSPLVSIVSPSLPGFNYQPFCIVSPHRALLTPSPTWISSSPPGLVHCQPGPVYCSSGPATRISCSPLGPANYSTGLTRVYGTNIQEKDKKKAKNKQNRARNGKDKVNPKPKSVKVKSQPHEENTT